MLVRDREHDWRPYQPEPISRRSVRSLMALLKAHGVPLASIAVTRRGDVIRIATDGRAAWGVFRLVLCVRVNPLIARPRAR